MMAFRREYGLTTGDAMSLDNVSTEDACKCR